MKKMLTMVLVCVPAAAFGQIGNETARRGQALIQTDKTAVTQEFNVPWSRNNALIHTGVDIAASKGTPVYAIKSGVVDKIGNLGGSDGGYLVVANEDGTTTGYLHLNVSAAGQVRVGEIIGTIYSNHLHLNSCFQSAGCQHGAFPNPTYKSGNVTQFYSRANIDASAQFSSNGKKAYEMYNQYGKDTGTLSDAERISRLRAMIAEAEKGVPKNDRLAMALVGVFLQSELKIGNEIIVPIDRNRAFSLLKRSYDMGEVEAANGLIKAYANGWGVTRDRALATDLVQEAIAKGCTDCNNIQSELNQGSGPNLEFYPEQASGCAAPKDKKRTITRIEVPCSAGKFSGYGSIYFSRNKNKEICVFTGNVLNGLEHGSGRWDCDVEGRKFTVPRLINGRITLVQDEIIGGKYVTTGNFKNGKLEGFGEVSGPQNLFVSGVYKDNNLQKGYQIFPTTSEKRVALIFDNGVSFAKCSSDYDQAIDQNCSEGNRKIIFPAAVAERNVKMAAEAIESGAVVATGRVLAPPINCSDFSYSKTTALPTVSSGQNALCETIQKKLGSSQFRFLSFQKIDGLSSTVNGVKIYQMQYEAEIEYTADLHPECAERGAFMRYPVCNETITAGGMSVRGNRLPRVAASGSTIKRKGEITFTQYESGWKYSPPSGLD